VVEIVLLFVKKVKIKRIWRIGRSSDWLKNKGWQANNEPYDFSLKPL
jgi:hypothetical protein